MKNLWKFSLIALAIFSIASCDDDDEKNLEPTVPTTLSPINKATEVPKTITLNWKTSTDPEKTMVKYTLFVGSNEELADEDIEAKNLTESEYEISLKGHTTYFWKVLAQDAEGLTNESAVFSFTTDNSAPVKPTASFPEHEKVDVDQTVAFAWTAATDDDGDEIKYDLFVAETNVFVDADKKATDITLTTFEVADLKSNTQYFWKVVAKDTEGVSVESIIYNFTTQNGLPTISSGGFPENKAKDIEKVITFKWSESVDDKGAVKYNLFLSKKNTFADEDIIGKDLTTNEFTAEALEGHTEYFWKVNIVDSEGASVDSEVYSFTTINSLPSKAIAVSPANNATIDLEDITCKWTASVDADKDALKYDFYLSDSNVFTDEDVKGKDLTEVQFEVTSLKDKTQYFWKVVTKDSEGASVESDVFNFTTDYTAPVTVTITEPFQLIYEEQLYVNVAWTTSIEGLKHDVYVTANSEFAESDLKKADVEGLIFQVAGLDFESDYKVKVVAKNEAGERFSSEIYDLRTIAFKSEASGRPSHIKPANNFDGIPSEFEWSAVGKGVKYDLIVSPNSNFSAPIFEKKDMLETSVTVDLSAVAKGDVKYYWRVTARGEQGDPKTSFMSNFLKNLAINLEMGTFTDTRDSHEYKTVTFKGKTWLAENFAYLPYFADETADEKKCSVYGVPIVKPMFGGAGWVMPTIEEAKAHENFAKYGVMYSAYALESIVPDGWHVATDEEWKEIEKLSGVDENDLDYSGSSYRGETVHKFLSTSAGWTNTPAATDKFKLGIKPGGYNKVLEEIGEGRYTYFWTNSFKMNPFSGTKSYFHRIFSNKKTGVGRNTNKVSDTRMYIRLVKD